MLALFLNEIKLKSGEENRGYGAVSIYILRGNDKGEKILLEPAYDVQAEE
ncbi:MAG: hypothetical protein HYV53_04405 [Parcubacteria group bacterium]|nr:hypothetical protein [Parcubacteria group bacterium]